MRNIIVNATLKNIRTVPISLQQARDFSHEVSRAHSNIGSIYHELLNQSVMPIHCNFISQVVDAWAEDPNKQAIRCIDNESNSTTEITYSNLKENSHKISSFFANEGFKKGDSVALMLGQYPAWWYSLAGLMRSGIAAVPCSKLLTEDDLRYRFNSLGMKGIITIPQLQDRINAIKHDCPTLQTTVTTGEPAANWRSIPKILSNPYAQVPQVITTTEDPCLYLFTSGTTGQPKAVQHNADYPFFHWPTGRRWLQATSDDLIYNASDTGWGFTVWITTAAWSMGSKLLITPTNKKFNSKLMLETIKDQNVTIFCAAPTVLRLLVVDPDFKNITLPSLRRIVTVGEALDESVINAFESKGIEIAVGFGQAETPLIMGRVDEQPHIHETMGKPIEPYNVVIIDDNYRRLPLGSFGQIAIDLMAGGRGGIMRKYANDPAKTENSRSPDGRYHLTGDFGYCDSKGNFYYGGRKDDLIKSRGYRIGPDEVEKAGMSHPAIAKIAVVGIRTNKNSQGRTVKAFILLKPGYSENDTLVKEIQEHIKCKTGPYKYPRIVEFFPLNEWEKYETTSGKIRRAGLREREENKLLEDNPEKDNILSPLCQRQ